MGLSSNSLIHFTNRDSLKGILEEEFRIKYCTEIVRAKRGAGFNVVVPMVSFCDIPLSEIKNHIQKYGRYGIGLSKKWGKKKGLNPVLYLEQKSTLIKNMIYGFSKLLEEDINKYTTTQYRIAEVIRYIKNYEGILVRKGKKIKKNYRFSDEQEWRYVPSKSNARIFINADDKTEANQNIENLRLGFNPNDITYIVVKNEKEIDEFIQIIINAKSKKYSENEIKRLTTRIITSKQILSDF